jgi:hypothetical protein
MREKYDFCFGSILDFEKLKIDNFSYDLRRIGLMDGHGAITFICYLVSRIREEDCYIHLIFDNSIKLIKLFNFFGAIKQYLNSKIFWDDESLESINTFNTAEWIKLPITKLGFVGAQTKVTDNLTTQLGLQGYSEDVCAYIGWAMGELSDNASTHAGVHPCFLQCTQINADSKFLLFTIGDVGIGISNSLRNNPRYSHLSDEEAVLIAFKPYISGRSDDENRGKGLTDVLKIAMECSSVLQVESKGVGYSFKFNAGRDNFKKNIPPSKTSGTIISILFIEGNFASFDRDDVEKFVKNCMETS